ncbi:hypothetical protein LSTR_LSTR002554 [Laodelphax striatellus]|uniref:Uncharacterized protein n=1 Tax=Laodelphax striatellus TaxID=195883 RepID=A0A482XN78_LAOST|nr:hypothetical protein LSTR_LSTR002554 [Laodelphax striatellus]
MNDTGRSDCVNNSYFVNFNQDISSLAVGSKSGYRLFSLLSVDSLVQIYENETEDISIVERLFSSSLVAVVCLSSPRKLKVCHFNKGTEICNYSYSNTILAVKLNRVRLVVCLEESLYIHNIRDMKVLHTIRDTPPNPTGLCTLSSNGDNCFLAYPGSNTIGEVQIFDANNLQAKTMIAAHDSPLAALAFSPNGCRLATASEKGTVIRVFNVADGSRLFEFRRGVKRCVTISTLAFSTDASFLVASSNTETVHIFKLDENQDPSLNKVNAPVEDSQSWMGYLSKAVSASANYLPSQVTDVFCQGRAFASVHLPVSGLKTVCAITTVQKVLRLLVASSDGVMYVYNFDANEGGCVLVHQHKLYGKSDTDDRVDGSDDKQSAAKKSTANNDTQVVETNELESNETFVSVGGGHCGANGNGYGEIHHSCLCFVSVPEPGSISSYAGILKGNCPGTMSDSEKFREMVNATESPPKGGFQLNDDSEFPPVTQKTE